jgi:hypothetical protein
MQLEVRVEHIDRRLAGGGSGDKIAWRVVERYVGMIGAAHIEEHRSDFRRSADRLDIRHGFAISPSLPTDEGNMPGWSFEKVSRNSTATSDALGCELPDSS